MRAPVLRWWCRRRGFKKQRRRDRVVGSTGIVGAALLDIRALEEYPRGRWKVRAISGGSLPPWSAPLAPGVSYRLSDLANSEHVMVLKPLSHIAGAFYIACDPRRADTAAREAKCGMLPGALSFTPICTKPGLALAVGSTGIVGAALLDGGNPGVRRLLAPVVRHGPFGFADLVNNINHVFYVAWDPRRADAASGVANLGMIPDALSITLVWINSTWSDALIVGSTGIVGAALLDGGNPGVRMVCAIRLLAPVVCHGPFGFADLDNNISHVFYVAWDPRRAVLRNVLCANQVPWSVSTVLVGAARAPELIFAVHRLTIMCSPRVVLSRNNGLLRCRVACEGVSNASDAELVAEHALCFKVKEAWASPGFVNNEDLPRRQVDELTNCRSSLDALFNMEREHVNTVRILGFRNKVPHMAWHQILCFICILFILGPFTSNVNAHTGLGVCPERSISDFFPRNTCPVIHLTSAHWSHSKAIYRGELDDLLPSENTWCDVVPDKFVILATGLLGYVVWKLEKGKIVKFFIYKRSLIYVWADTILASVFYCACWILYGHLLSQSKEQKKSHLGKHLYEANSIVCSMFLVILLSLFARHEKEIQAWQFIRTRLLVLFCLLLPLYILWDKGTNADNIFQIGLIGFLAMVPMYGLKWFTFVGFKRPTTGLNIIIVVLCLCCNNFELKSWYGRASFGSFCFRIADITRSFYMMSAKEWSDMKGEVKQTLKTIWREIVDVQRKFRSGGSNLWSGMKGQLKQTLKTIWRGIDTVQRKFRPGDSL